MHPFGGTPRCPRCDKSVYAAEQVMGPGRKLYHKPCLSCTICKKRLDSVTLLEHDEQPYCKNCHVKNFGARDLRQANLPDRDEVFGTSMSPPRTAFISPPASPRKVEPPLPSPTRHTTGGRFDHLGTHTYTPILKPNMNRSSPNLNVIQDEDVVEEAEEEGPAGVVSQNGRTPLSRTVPLARPASPGKVSSHTTGTTGRFAAKSVDWTPGRYPVTMGRSASVLASSGQVIPQLVPTATGTRYGKALGGDLTGNPPARQWGNSTPSCPKCAKSVYFAEQVKAIGKTYHKACLRCTSCDKRLDSFSLLEHDSQPYCKLCHVKNFGTTDLRQANLPNRDEVFGLSPPTSPRKLAAWSGV